MLYLERKNMYKVKGYFRDNTVSRYFIDKYDAIDFKDTVDANYPLRVTFEKGVYPMQTFIINAWNSVMDHRLNPLSNIQDMQTRHIAMQVLAWMWCIIFSMSLGSITVFGVSAVAHTLLIGGIVLTVGVFETAKRKPEIFNLRRDGYHSVSRSRQVMWINGQKVILPDGDPGGEHE
jgi:hypothetical protein